MNTHVPHVDYIQQRSISIFPTPNPDIFGQQIPEMQIFYP